MMQIYTDAINRSRSGSAQYVLSQGLYLELSGDKESVQKKVRQGYQIEGKFLNGCGYENYKVASPRALEISRNFLHNECNLDVRDSFTCISFSFQEFFDSLSKSEDLNVDLAAWSGNKRIGKHRLTGEKAYRLRDLFLMLGFKQDSEYLCK